jgi:pilus assembly protein CpaB
MSARSRRRRGVLLVALAIACGGLAASRVDSAERRVADQVGPLVPVLVARSELPAGTKIVADRLAVRQVPARFAPADALPGPAAAVGLRPAASVAPGGYVTEGVLAEGPSKDDARGGVAPGERATEVAVTGGEALLDAPPGTRVDVLVTTDPANGRGRAYLALQDVELLATRAAPSGDAGDGAAAHATTLATLRVTLRQAVYLTAAQSFAREIRLLARAPGDRSSAPALTVDGRHL